MPSELMGFIESANRLIYNINSLSIWIPILFRRLKRVYEPVNEWMKNVRNGNPDPELLEALIAGIETDSSEELTTDEEIERLGDAIRDARRSLDPLCFPPPQINDRARSRPEDDR